MSKLVKIELGNIREILSVGEKIWIEKNAPAMDLFFSDWEELKDNHDLVFYRGFNRYTDKVSLMINDLVWENIDPISLEIDGTDRTHKFKAIPNIREVIFELNNYEYVEYNVLTWLDESILKEKDEAKKLAYQAKRDAIISQIHEEVENTEEVEININEFKETVKENGDNFIEDITEVPEETEEQEEQEEVLKEDPIDLNKILDEMDFSKFKSEKPAEPAEPAATYGSIFKNIAKATCYVTAAIVLEGTSYVLGKIVD